MEKVLLAFKKQTVFCHNIRNLSQKLFVRRKNTLHLQKYFKMFTLLPGKTSYLLCNFRMLTLLKMVLFLIIRGSAKYKKKIFTK